MWPKDYVTINLNVFNHKTLMQCTANPPFLSVSKLNFSHYKIYNLIKSICDFLQSPGIIHYWQMDNLFELEKLFLYENMAHKANRLFSSFFQDVLSFTYINWNEAFLMPGMLPIHKCFLSKSICTRFKQLSRTRLIFPPDAESHGYVG